MESNGRNVIIGAIVGALAGYLIGSLIAEKILESEMNLEDLDIPDEIVEDEEPNIMGRQKKSKTSKTKRVNYTEFFDDGKTPEGLALLAAKYNEGEGGGQLEQMLNDITHPDANIEEVAVVEEPVQQEPKIISIVTLQECIDNVRGYGHAEMNYYAVDDIITDDEDTPLTNPERLIGEEALISFGKDSDDPDAVYVKNDRTKMIYEIVRLEASYSKTVLGIDDESKSPRNKPRRANGTNESDKSEEE